MDFPSRIEVNCTTGEVTEHLLTAEEILQRQKDAINADLLRIKAEEEAQAKAVAKEELLAKLGITAEEATLLLS